tara:strand:- start:1056 stop:1616 length:561 start_codon:yes stop_codon:yes gene_type:complete
MNDSEINPIPKIKRVFSDTKSNLDAMTGLQAEDLAYGSDTERLYRQPTAGSADWATIARADQTIVKWLSSSIGAMTDSGRTSTLTYTDLDLTEHTSTDCTAVLMMLQIRGTVIGSGNTVELVVRKNGTTPSEPVMTCLDKAGATANAHQHQFVICGLDDGQVLEYQIQISTGWTVDSAIHLVGYIE